MMIDLKTIVRDFIAHLEDYKENAYQDSKGVWTVGFGTTILPSGARVKKGETCSLPQAYAYLSAHLEKNVYPQLKKYPDLPPKIYVALCSLIYNVGELGPTIQDSLKRRKFELLPMNFMQYVFVKGKVCDGLVNRRKEEVAYFTS